MTHPTRLRVVLAAMGAEEFALLHETCVAAGHVPVAYAYSRSMRPGEPADPYAVSTVTRVVEALPGSVDLLLPAGPAGLGEALSGYRADLLVIYGFNWILPPGVFSVSRLGTINVHPSLLPRYRGPAPVLWAIRNGDPEIGVTVHRVDTGVDTGPILAQQGGVALDDYITPERLRDRIAPVLQEVLSTALARVATGADGEPQPEQDAGYAPLMTPEYRRLDLTRPAREVHHLVRLLRFMGKDEEAVMPVGDRWLRLIAELRQQGHRLSPVLPRLRVVAGAVQRGGEVIECGGQLPPVAQVTVDIGGPPVERDRFVVPVQLLVRLAGEVHRGGFPAAVAELSLDDGGTVAADERLIRQTLRQLDPRQLRQPVPAPDIVVDAVRSFEGSLHRRVGFREATGHAVDSGG